MPHRRTLATLTLAAGLLLSGCASNDTKADAAFNDADVEFAQQMIPHHQQALEMAKLAESRAISPEVKDLAVAIEGAQDPEIQAMTGWLQEWDQDVPSLGGMSEHSGHDLTGMMDEHQMADLEAASGAKFDQLFLTLMIEHHQGAIEMARTEQADGEYAPAVELAEGIETAQTAEVATMRGLLGS
jgi:uncharacterized protein (DUF305 family)